MASPPSPLLVAGLLKKDFSAASLKMICVGNLQIYKKELLTLVTKFTV